MTAYYNEFDPYAAEWLRSLISKGLIADGEVDSRSVVDVRADDLRGFTQCHFFAGIGGWSYALRLAGWPDDRPVWTGSCPCQPFSAAGKRGGTDDERHLWPEWFRLIRECRPPVIFGEQVASSIATGRYGGDGVQSLWQTWQLLNLRKDWLERRPTVHLQGLPKLGCAERGNGKTHEPGNASQQTGSVGEGPSRIPEDGIRLGRAVGSGEDRAGGLPDERRAVRSVGDAWVCDPVPGPDQSDFGLHERQHQGDPLRAECGAGELGTDQTVQCRDADIKDQLEAINDLIAEVSRDIEEANGASWLNALQLDLGREGYTVGACAAPACSLGAPHIRQRLWIVGERAADTDSENQRGRGIQRPGEGNRAGDGPSLERPAGLRADGGMGNAISPRLEGHAGNGDRAGGWPVEAGSTAQAGEPRRLADAEHDDGRADQPRRRPEGRAADGRDGSIGRLADGASGGRGERGDALVARESGHADGNGTDGRVGNARRERDEPGRRLGDVGRASGSEQGEAQERERRGDALTSASLDSRPGPTNGFWRDADWLHCRDGKWRPVEPGTFPLAHGLPNRVGRLRGYGNAIVPQVAAEVIAAWMECRP